MAEITAGMTLIRNSQNVGLNIAVVETAATADDGDTFELETVLNEADGGPGIDVKKVIYVNAIQDPTGTAASEPMKWSDTTDTITIGGATDNKRRTIMVVYI